MSLAYSSLKLSSISESEYNFLAHLLLEILLLMGNNCLDMSIMAFTQKVCEKYWIIMVCLIGLSGCLAKTEQVIEFGKNSDEASPVNKTSPPLKNLQKTQDFTICFRYMPRFTMQGSYGLYILYTDQLRFWIGYDRGYFYLKSRNSTQNERYSRRVQFCEPFPPGKWTSLCLRIRIFKETQEIVLFQQGKPCSTNKYEDGDFEWFYIKKMWTVKDL